MLDRLLNLWNAIPAPIRTVINVSIAGGVLVIAGDVVAAQGVTGVDWTQSGTDALNAVGVGLATAAVGALNPLDSGYGIERGTDETTPGH